MSKNFFFLVSFCTVSLDKIQTHTIDNGSLLKLHRYEPVECEPIDVNYKNLGIPSLGVLCYQCERSGYGSSQQIRDHKHFTNNHMKLYFQFTSCLLTRLSKLGQPDDHREQHVTNEVKDLNSSAK